jgi:IS30 family transposase
MRKVTKEQKITMKELRAKGVSFAGIGRILNFSSSTIQYHLNEKQKENTIKRAIKNEKPRDRKEYQKIYRADRYNEDEEFRERVQKHSRESWRKRHGKSNNLS